MARTKEQNARYYQARKQRAIEEGYTGYNQKRRVRLIETGQLEPPKGATHYNDILAELPDDKKGRQARAAMAGAYSKDWSKRNDKEKIRAIDQMLNAKRGKRWKDKVLKSLSPHSRKLWEKSK